MDQVRLGNTGLVVSRISLGCMSYGKAASANNGLDWPWALSEEEGRTFIKRALELGVNFFDTANNYSGGESEAVLGRAIRDYARRDDVVLATKVCSPVRPGPFGRGLSRKAIMAEVEKSLKRLCIDLYQIHRFDYETPLEETLEALDDLVRAGKVRYLGASNLYAWQLMKALAIQRANGWARFVSIQDFYNLLNREDEREMLPLCSSEGVGANPWSPLARGRLARPWAEQPRTARAASDKFASIVFKSTDAIDKPVVDRLNEVARRRELPPSQVALAWLLHKPAVTSPVVGATKLGQLDDAVAAISVKLSPEEIALLEEPYLPHPSPAWLSPTRSY